MRAVLDYCTGGAERKVPEGTLVIHEGGKTGHLFVLMAGKLEVIKGDVIVAVDGHEVADARAIQYRLTTRGVGNRCRLDIVRKGQQLALDVAGALPSGNNAPVDMELDGQVLKGIAVRKDRESGRAWFTRKGTAWSASRLPAPDAPCPSRSCCSSEA